MFWLEIRYFYGFKNSKYSCPGNFYKSLISFSESNYGFKHAAAAAKSRQSCLTLCNPRDGSPPGSAIPGILQARALEWVAISFSMLGTGKLWMRYTAPFWCRFSQGNYRLHLVPHSIFPYFILGKRSLNRVLKRSNFCQLKYSSFVSHVIWVLVSLHNTIK